MTAALKVFKLACALVLLSPLLAAGGGIPPVDTVTRVSAKLNGVISPRGFFNVLVPLRKIQGVRAVKLDLAKSQITIDFSPRNPVTPAEIRQVMVDAGYRPGQVDIALLPQPEATETGPGWMKIKHPSSNNALVRWAQENF